MGKLQKPSNSVYYSSSYWTDRQAAVRKVHMLPYQEPVLLATDPENSFYASAGIGVSTFSEN
jgi:hypothetical protein